jgi:hypothetical protein
LSLMSVTGRPISDGNTRKVSAAMEVTR